MPMQCPCSSKKTYDNCCKPLHDGQPAEDALQLMRSRFSAYALDLPNYIVASTHPASPQYVANIFAWKRSISRFSRSNNFVKLEILDFKAQPHLATVTFIAHLTHEGEDCSFTEKSFFEVHRGRWLYRGGQLVEGHAPNLVTVGQLRVLPLAYYGDPILRKHAEAVKEISDDIRTLVEEMIETMDACNGMGLAAPQVHHSIRLFIIRTPIEDEEGHVELGDVKIFINPIITASSKETWLAPEGCLSIPTIQADVERPKEITVQFTDLSGAVATQTFSGWEAKVILHENDHLNGVLFVDHPEGEEHREFEPFLKKLKRRIHDGTEM